MEPWYEKAEGELAIQHIPEEYRNRNAMIFQEGFEKLGYRLAPLRRAQKDCRYHEGNDCIQCLNGCPIGSKQSMPETVLKRALESGLVLESQFEVEMLTSKGEDVIVQGINMSGEQASYKARKLVLAAGAVGNSKLLLKSGFGERLPAIGLNFYCHPQYNSFGIYEDEVNSHRGPFQAFKSDDLGFREAGFKLENVYAPASAIAMLIGGFGIKNHSHMENLSHFACIEVCTRDTQPGCIRVNGKGRVILHKKLNKEDKRRYQRGVDAINNIFQVTGAKEVINCSIGIGLHLMGGCCMGMDSTKSVVGPDFRLHGFRNIYVADSSIFPNAPGINPSLTIMALSKKAASGILGEV
jgi:choline dehydrogenase-like flavoprotein